jgi:predicted dehydrogenase
MQNEISRREFIEKAATLTAIGFAAPQALAASKAKPARQPSLNSKIQLGLIGCGGQGQSNLRACAKHPDTVITAACDVWPDRREHMAERYKPTCKAYADWREVLTRPDVDAVIIATPPHWHTLQAVEACRAGKDIYLQKPMTLHLGESLAVRNAVRRHGVISQIGTQIHASENYRRVVEYIRSGNLGSIATVRTFNVMNQTPLGLGHSTQNPLPEGFDWEMWVGPGPMRHFNKLIVQDAFNHSSWMDYSGGWTPGMAPHIIDLPVWALDLGYPTEISSSGGRFALQDDGDVYDNHEVLWRYPKLTMTWMSSLTNSYGFDLHGEPVPKRRLGIYFHGTNGTMYANYSTFKIVPEGDKMKDMQAPPPSIPPSPGHELEWLNCIKTRQQPSCSVFYHTHVDVPIVLSLLSLKLGRSIRFDPVKERIVGDREAAKLAVPAYRKPWKFPKEYLKG